MRFTNNIVLLGLGGVALALGGMSLQKLVDRGDGPAALLVVMVTVCLGCWLSGEHKVKGTIIAAIIASLVLQLLPDIGMLS